MDALDHADRIFASVNAIDPGVARPAFDGIAKSITSDLRNHSNTIRRYLMLDDKRLTDLGREGALGRHWTVDGSEMSLDALHAPDEADSTWKVYEVEAWIDGLLPVDVPATVATRAVLPWEREIILRPDAEVVVRSVSLFDENTFKATRAVRHDLVGKRLHAGAVQNQSQAMGLPVA